MYMTKLKTPLAYADLHSGEDPEFFDYYARLIKIIVVSMLYGFCMPIFLVLSLIILVFTYIIDKLKFAFYFQKPPMIDDTLQKNAIYFLKWGAFFYIAFGWWGLTNRQMFENVVMPL